MNLMRGLFLILVLSSTNTVLFSAEAGMPQLDPTYWASQAFWLILVFSVLYVSVAKFYLPKIKKNLDDRENKIKEDLDEANELKRLSEKKLAEYDLIMENSKKEISKTILEAKKKLSDDIEMKKSAIEKEIEIEMTKTQKDIFDLKKSSIKSINSISKEIAANIIEKIVGDKLNESSIQASIDEVSKKNLGKYL